MSYKPLFRAYQGAPVFDSSGRLVWANVRSGALRFTLSLHSRNNHSGSYNIPSGTDSVSTSVSLDRPSYGQFSSWAGPQVSVKNLGQDNRGINWFLVSVIKSVSASYNGNKHTVTATYGIYLNTSGSQSSGYGGSAGRSYEKAGYIPEGEYDITASPNNILGAGLVNGDCVGSFAASFS